MLLNHRFDETAFRMHRWLLVWRIPATTFAIGVVSSAVVNIFTDTAATTFVIIIWRMTDRNSPLSYLMLFSVLMMIFFWIGERGLSRFCKRCRWDIQLADLVRKRTSDSILKHSGSGITLGENLTMQLCPELHRGWDIDRIQIRWESGTQFYVMSQNEARKYSDFREQNKSKRWYLEKNDGISVRLVKNPTSFTDSPELILEVEQCRYSQVQFTNRELATNDSKRNTCIENAISGQLRFANTFVLHIVVITSDKQILATLSSEKKDYFANSWSFSIEEQLRVADIDSANTTAGLVNWVKRALFEELGVTNDSFQLNNIRIISVFLEGHNLNSGLCCVVKLSIDKETLDAAIKVHRQDVEFVDHNYYSYEQAVKLLRYPDLKMHPTSEYRLFLALSYLLTPPLLAHKLFGT